MTMPGMIAPKLHMHLKAWAGDKRGSAAIEFAMISVPFFIIIFGLLEICLLFIMTAIMENSLSETSRLIKTGQLQANTNGETALRSAICSNMLGLLPDCLTSIEIDSKVFSNFSTATAPPTSSLLDSNGNLNTDNFGYAPGLQNEIVVVRIFYEWDLIVPGLSAPLTNMSGNRRLLQATVAFRNEPFGTVVPAPPSTS